MNEEAPELEFPPPEAPTNVPAEPIGEPPPPPEPPTPPDNREAEIAIAALKAGKPLQGGVSEDARVEDFKPKS